MGSVSMQMGTMHSRYRVAPIRIGHHPVLESALHPRMIWALFTCGSVPWKEPERTASFVVAATMLVVVMRG